MTNSFMILVSHQKPYIPEITLDRVVAIYDNKYPDDTLPKSIKRYINDSVYAVATIVAQDLLNGRGRADELLGLLHYSIVDESMNEFYATSNPVDKEVLERIQAILPGINDLTIADKMNDLVRQRSTDGFKDVYFELSMDLSIAWNRTHTSCVIVSTIASSLRVSTHFRP